MTNRVRAGALALAVSLAATPVAAQVLGMPVVNAGVTRGLALSFDYGKPNEVAGGGYALGATAGLGFGPLGVTARLSRLDSDGLGELWSAGGTANYKVIGGPLVPLAVTLQAGAGYASPDFACAPPGACDISEWRFPIGLGVAFTIPNPALAIKPWIAPRIDITRRSAYGTFDAETDSEFAVSGGIELNMLTGFGLHAAYDWTKRDGGNPGIFSAGLHYNFRIPGL